jgi:hypothetical protein
VKVTAAIAGLAAAGSGEYQQRAVDIAHGFALAGVKLGHFRRITLATELPVAVNNPSAL